MKKLTKLFAGLATAAALLMGVGCTNQADYVEDNTARNAFNLAGIYVEGLDESYNGSAFKLNVKIINEDGEEDTLTAIEGTVADSYVDEDGKTVGHKSGTIYSTKVANKGLYDGDAMAVLYQKAQIAAGKTGTDIKTFAASTFECTLTVGNDTFMAISEDGTSKENIKLSVPTSPAGTSDSALASRWFNVVVKDGIATYSLEKSVTEPVNVTLANIKLNLFNNTEAEIAAMEGVTIEKAAKAGTHQKINLKITGLKDNAGTEVVIGGSDLYVSDSGDFGSHWYDVETPGYKQTISDEGTVEFTIYSGRSGSTCNVDMSGWGRGYELTKATTEIVVVSVNDLKENGPRLLENAVSTKTMDDSSSDSTNFLLPSYCTGNYDITITIAKDKLDESYVTQADPVVAAAEFYIDGIKVINATAPGADEKEYIFSGDGSVAYHNWVPENGWNTSSHYYTDDDIGAVSGNYGWVFDEPVAVQPGASTFKLGVQIVSTEDGEINWDSKVSGDAIYLPSLLTSDYAAGHYVFIVDGKSGDYAYLQKAASVSIVDEDDVTLSLTTLVIDAELKGVELIGDFNSWDDSGTVSGAVAGGKTTFDISAHADAFAAGKGFKVRSVGTWTGDYNLGLSTGDNITISASGAVTNGTLDTVYLTYSDDGFTAVKVGKSAE